MSELDPDLEQRVRTALERTGDQFVVADVTWHGPTVPTAADRPRHHVSRAIGAAWVAALIAVSLAIGAGAVVLLSKRHSTQLTTAEPSARVPDRATLEMPRGKTTRAMHLRNAPANVPFTVVVRSAASAQFVVNMDVHGTAAGGWASEGCAWKAGHVTCRYHCGGGAPGGKWAVVVTKTSVPAVLVSIRVMWQDPAAST